MPFSDVRGLIGDFRPPFARFSSVRSADRIYVLHDGEIVEEGTHDLLMRLGGRYAELFTLQAKAYFPEEYRALAGT